MCNINKAVIQVVVVRTLGESKDEKGWWVVGWDAFKTEFALGGEQSVGWAMLLGGCGLHEMLQASSACSKGLL